MKKLLFVFVIAAFIVGCQTDEKSAPKEADVNSISYNLGILMGSQLKGNVDELQFDDYLAGFTAGYQTELDNEQLSSASQKLQEYQKERQKRLSETAVKKGDDFRAENAQKDGVTVLESGLQYEVLAEGKGDKPKATDRVSVHYKGTLIDGTEFDSSFKRGQPATFGLNGVIKGWTEGLQLMSPGAKYRFVIPPELAYGERGAGGSIGPNETLVFEVELLEIEKPAEEETK